MSDLIRQIGELHIAATVDYNEKAAALEAADKKYIAAFDAADRARTEARNAALTARDEAVNAAYVAYDAKIAEIADQFSATVDQLDAEIEPFQKAEEAARLTFDKARLAWAAVVDDVAVGGLDDDDDVVQLVFDEDDDDGEETDEATDGEEAGVRFGQEEEGEVVHAGDLYWQEGSWEAPGEAVQGVAEAPANPAEPASGNETSGEAGVTDAFDAPIPAPTADQSGEVVQDSASGPANETQGTTPQEEVTPQVEVTNGDFTEATVTGTLTVGETVVEPAPAPETGGVEPTVVEPSVGEGSVEPSPAPALTEPLPPVEAAPETPATFQVEYADVPVSTVDELPLNVPHEVTGPDGDFPKQQ